MKRNVLFLCICLFSSLYAEERDSLQMIELQEIEVVSPIKENGLLRRQPSSVTLLGKKKMEELHITSLKEASTLVPNLFIPDYGSRLTNAIYIRGIGSRINNPAVGLYVDDVPYMDKSAFDFNFYDIERMDVLRGPQGTLYGRNTMGGIIRVYTKNPFSYEGTDIKLGYATKDNHRNLSLTHYHRVSPKFAFSGGGYYEGGDGFFRNDYTGKKVDDMLSAGGRVRGIYKATNRLHLDFNVSYDYTNQGAYPYYYTGSITSKESYPDLVGKISNNREHFYRRNLLNVGVNVEYQAEGWQMNAVTGYQYLNDRMFIDQDFLTPDLYSLEQRQCIHSLNEEVIFKNKGERKWEWINGINIMYQSLRTEAPVTFYREGLNELESNINQMMPNVGNIPMLQQMGFSGMGVNFRDNELYLEGTYKTPTLGVALFHQSTYHFTKKWSAVLGVRLDYEHQGISYSSPAEVGYGFSMPNTLNNKMSINLQDLTSKVLYSGEMQNDYFRILPKLALKYDFNKGNNLYASMAMGQRSGGYNVQMFSDLMQGALSADMMQGIKEGVVNYVNNLIATNPRMPKQVVEYIRKMMNEKMPNFSYPSVEQIAYKPEYALMFELGTHLTLWEHKVLLDATLFYSRIYDQQVAKFVSSGLGRMMTNADKSQSCGGELSLRWKVNRSISFSGNYGYTHATFLDYTDGTKDYSGNYVPFVPKHSVGIDLSYTWYIAHSKHIKNISIGANGLGTGRIYWTESNSTSQPFYATLGGRLCIEGKPFSIVLWGKNLTNTSYNTFYFESFGRGFEQHGKPLQIGIDVKVQL
ncbi:MAG TPA: TonB-dependent receptor [Porphyromonadaceae bacterium]|nr:TonB-dependent receptor [Porphyromonadaceae bacterium]